MCVTLQENIDFFFFLLRTLIYASNELFKKMFVNLSFFHKCKSPVGLKGGCENLHVLSFMDNSYGQLGFLLSCLSVTQFHSKKSVKLLQAFL